MTGSSSPLLVARRNHQESGVNERNTFQILLCQTPFEEPTCFGASLVCCCCSQVILRRRVLNHVHPSSGWKHYRLLQGYNHYFSCYRSPSFNFSREDDDPCSCCYWYCFVEPGQRYRCETDCPVLCLCLEVLLWPGHAAMATSAVLRERHQLVLHRDDFDVLKKTVLRHHRSSPSKLRRLLSCWPEGPSHGSSILFLCTVASILGQVQRELRFREGHNDAPTGNTMIR